MEEAAEAIDALEHGTDDDVVEELGDVLLQIAFHAVIAEEEGAYGYRDIESAIVEKLVRRHPHVFGDARVADADEVLTRWSEIKQRERTASGRAQPAPAEAVPRSLPALARAAAMDDALDWDVHQDDLSLSLRDAATDPARIPRLLLAAAQVARRAGLDPEIALRDELEARVAADRS